MATSKLSLVIITLNEAANIGRCISSALPVADEIVIVDSGSTDGTREIAQGLGARVVHRAFTNYIEQKNFATQQAVYDYVLNLDGDEALDPTLLQAIQQRKLQGFTADAYSMNRLNFYCGRPIKTCGWYPDTKIRLWNRNKGGWTGQLVHELLTLHPGSTTQHLGGDILHYSFPTPQALTRQVDKFAQLAARQLKTRGALYLWLKLIFSPGFKWFKNYFIKLGFTDGAMGFTICRQQAREVFLKYYLALQLK